jgi:hypothetical protein
MVQVNVEKTSIRLFHFYDPSTRKFVTCLRNSGVPQNTKYIIKRPQDTRPSCNQLHTELFYKISDMTNHELSHCIHSPTYSSVRHWSFNALSGIKNFHRVTRIWKKICNSKLDAFYEFNAVVLDQPHPFSIPSSMVARQLWGHDCDSGLNGRSSCGGEWSRVTIQGTITLLH